MSERRVALVTGAGAGIGRAIALRLAREERAQDIVVNDLDEGRAKEVAEEIEALGNGARGLPESCDVTEWEQVQDMFRRIQARAGGVDVLVNNAGVPANVPLGLGSLFVETDPADWEPWLSLNLYGVLYCTRLALPSMIERKWGRVVAVVSDAGRVGEPRMCAYAAGKAGAAGFIRAVAREVGRHGVTSNAVALGTIKHGAIEAFLPADVEAKMLKRYVMPRLGRPEDAAAMVSFLCSEDAGWITAQTYPVNGGYSVAT